MRARDQVRIERRCDSGLSSCCAPALSSLARPSRRLHDDIVHHFLRSPVSLKTRNWRSAPVPFSRMRMDIVDFLTRAQFVDHVVHKLKIVRSSDRETALRFAYRSRSVCRRSRSARPPFVLHQQGAAIETKALIRGMQLIEFGDSGLDQRGDRDGLVGAHRHVADAELQRGKVRVRADIPPDFLGVVDAVGLDQQLDEALEFAPTREVIRGYWCAETCRKLCSDNDFRPVSMPSQNGELVESARMCGRK